MRAKQMLDYEWMNQSPITQETGHNPQPNRPFFEPYASQNYALPTHFHNPVTYFPATSSHHQQYQIPTTQFPVVFDPHAYMDNAPPYSSPFGIEQTGPTGFSFAPKTEPMVNDLEPNEFSNRIGLNLGGRTYFANTEDDIVTMLYRRSQSFETGLVNSARCRAEGCNADLTLAKHYHRRHKVCEFHSKAASVITGGLTQRFCQQCSRFHVLLEFDNGKRSCRRRLADHNRRRRKSQQQPSRSQLELADVPPNSSSENLDIRSPPDSGQSSSSVTIAISPPRISLDYFGHRPYSTVCTTSSTSSIFY